MNPTVIDNEAKRQLALLKARCVDVLVEDELYHKLCHSVEAMATAGATSSGATAATAA